VRRLQPPPLRAPDQSRRLPPEEGTAHLRVRREPTVDPAAIHTLASCDWVRKGLPLCLIGDSGSGKSHLLIALGTETAMAGFRVKYVLATKLVIELVEAADEKLLTKTIAGYGRVDLFCSDELGNMELDRRAARLKCSPGGGSCARHL
jgi:DNA replication protein DnaC